ncbi:transmembrane protein 70 homolog, mitochondrial [Schistocerca cancellata]|uniref:transmembrane protein 70 homolog, mitochondrial n=1 Tax=Schistocerca cancellata TaxID=274614 RepID=UPI0021187DEA|nr:transmembrane protein 70 homolog, mitochondrial [Schistocerca cancellata]
METLRVTCVLSRNLRKSIFCERQLLNHRLLTINVFAARNQSTQQTDVKVYHGPLAQQIRGVKLFSLVTSAGGLVAQPYLIQHATTFGNLPLSIAMLGFIGCFTYVTPFLLHWITKKYVTEIRYTPDREVYTAVVYNFFLKEKKIIFHPEDVEVPEVPGMFSSFHVRGIPLFVDPRMFEDKSHYARIMGYDKPLDLKLGDLENDKKT